jgi:DNA-binding IclR family transcriptional regulator
MPAIERDPSRARYEIRAVSRALSLLRVFISDEPPLSLIEISKATKLDPSTTFRMLVTLQAQGFAEQDPLSGKYRPGVTCLELGSRFLLNNDIRHKAIGVMEELRDHFGETVHLAVLDGTEVVYLEKLAGLHPIGIMSSRVGNRSPAHCTGVGKALLAFLPPEELEARYPNDRLARFTEKTIVHLSSLRSELARVREEGLAIDQQEHEADVMCVAVPIFDHKGIAAAISLSGPVERVEQHMTRGALTQTLKHAGAELSSQLGWGRGVEQLGHELGPATGRHATHRARAQSPRAQRARSR